MRRDGSMAGATSEASYYGRILRAAVCCFSSSDLTFDVVRSYGSMARATRAARASARCRQPIFLSLTLAPGEVVGRSHTSGGEVRSQMVSGVRVYAQVAIKLTEYSTRGTHTGMI